MEQNEVQLDGVTYLLSRSFIGTKSACEVLIEHLSGRVKEAPSIDLSDKTAV